MDPLAQQGLQERQDQVAHLDLLALLDHLGPQDLKENKDPQELLGQQVTREIKAVKVPKGKLETLVKEEELDL